MNELAARKQRLLMEADLHRQLLGLERARLSGRYGAGVDLLRRNRWWLLGGATLAGMLLVRKAGGVARWVPTIVTLWRIMKN